MREILLGTTNPSKVRRFEEFLSGYPVRFLTLKDMCIFEEPSENGCTPEENAALKARFYGKYFDTVICQDAGLYFDGLNFDDPRQPGLNIRTPNKGKRLNDEEMISYYSKFLHDRKAELGERPLAY